jgi:radical SAM superfamily enzyme YgiQ (UPF0313 family)
MYLATCARDHGYAVRVCSLTSSPLAALRGKIRAVPPRVVGFYCDHDNVTSVCRVSRLLRREWPELVLLVGGPQASTAGEEVLRDGDFDALVCGEGEHAFVELLDCFLRGRGRLEEIEGLVLCRAGAPVHTSPRPVHRRLDDLPIPDRTLSDDRSVPQGDERIITGRGCPFRCAFCVEGSAGSSTYRYRSPENVLQEVDELVATRELRYLLFMDDTFVAKPSRALRIADGLRRRREAGADFVWYCEARVDILCKHPELLTSLRHSGLARLQIGIESGAQEVLDAYRKGITVEQIRRAVGLAVEAGIPSIVGNFIIGGAHEDADTLARSLDFAQELIELAPGRLDLTTTYLTPYPGTAIRLDPAAYGVRILDADCLTGEDDRYPFVETEALDRWQILDAHERFHAVRKGTQMRQLQKGRVDEILIEEHFRLFERHGLLSQWMQLYLPFDHLARFYSLLLGEDCRRGRDVPPEEVATWYPVRTDRLAASRRGALVLRPLGPPIQLDALGSAIYELCSGRATLHRICELVGGRFFAAEPRHHVQALILGFLARLEARRLLVWSRV